MNKEIDVEKIRGLLEEEIEFTKGCPDDCEHIDAHAHKAGLAQLLSLLKPCETCGGAAICIHNGKANSQFAQDCIDNGYKSYHKPDCQAPQCKVCKQIFYTCNPLNTEGVCHNCSQAPAGDVEELTEKLIAELKEIPTAWKSRSHVPIGKIIDKACTHLTTLLKQIQQQYDKGWRDGSDAQDKADHEHIIKPLQAKIAQLEAKQKEAKE